MAHVKGVCEMECMVWGAHDLTVRAREGRGMGLPLESVWGCGDMDGWMDALVWCCGEGVKGFCCLWRTVVWGHVLEGYVLGHSFCNASGESTNLLMDIFQKGVGGPATMFFDGDGVNAIKFHGHCSSCS